MTVANQWQNEQATRRRSDVVIAGAGFAGLALAIALRQSLGDGDFSIEILSRKVRAKLVERPAYDPTGSRMRS